MNNNAQSIQFAFLVILMMILLMAFGSIWVFIRMSPVIASIIERNETSLQACEEMLAQLSLAQLPDSKASAVQNFETALGKAQKNITENLEPVLIGQIQSYYLAAFNGDAFALQNTVHSIQELAQVNRIAMQKADEQAQRRGYAGAWGVVFMASLVFWGGMLFRRKLQRDLVHPLEEIHHVILAQKSGNHFRRAVIQNLPKAIKPILDDLNHWLDQMAREASQKGALVEQSKEAPKAP